MPWWSPAGAGQVRGFYGLVFTRHFGAVGNSLAASLGAGAIRQKTSDYSCGCLCFCVFPPCPPCDCANPCPTATPPEGDGFGYHMGIGYEFSRRYEIVLEGLFGEIQDADPRQGDWTVQEFAVSLQLAWF